MSQAADSSNPDAADPDVELLRRLVERSCVLYERDLKSFLLGILRRNEDADYAFQRTVVNALSSAKSAQKNTIRGWLFRIALNEARQMLRAERRTRRLEEPEHHIEQTISSTPQTGEELTLRERALVLKQAIAALPAEYQEVIRRRMFQNQTFAEIAAELQLPLGTVLTWMRRALLKLRENVQLRDL